MILAADLFVFLLLRCLVKFRRYYRWRIMNFHFQSYYKNYYIYHRSLHHSNIIIFDHIISFISHQSYLDWSDIYIYIYILYVFPVVFLIELFTNIIIFPCYFRWSKWIVLSISDTVLLQIILQLSNCMMTYSLNTILFIIFLIISFKLYFPFLEISRNLFLIRFVMMFDKSYQLHD